MAVPPAFGAPPGPGPTLTPGVIQVRSSVMVVVLMIVTCGVYAIYWLYKTSDELRQATGDQTINPTTDLLLTLVTCGLWGLYIEYRNAQKVHQALVSREPNRKDQSQMVMILNIVMLFIGFTGLVATYIVQEELNALAAAAG